MTISNKYNAGFCVLTIKVVGSAPVIWIFREMVGNDISNSFYGSRIWRTRTLREKLPAHRMLDSLAERAEQVESGAHVIT